MDTPSLWSCLKQSHMLCRCVYDLALQCLSDAKPLHASSLQVADNGIYCTKLMELFKVPHVVVGVCVCDLL